MEITITKERFTELYTSMTVKALAEKLNVKENQIIKIAKQLGLSKPRGKQKVNRLVLEN